MAKRIKIRIENCIAGLIIFVLIFGWFFSGMPRIWQEPEIPPKVEQASAASGDVILFFAEGNIPQGWTCISCTGGDAFYELFPRGDSSYGGSSGGNAHGHSVSFVSDGGAGATTGYDPTPNEVTVPEVNHTHSSISSATTSNELALPPYFEFNMIYANNPSSIPTGAIAMFDTASVPAGWNLYNSADGLVIRGGPNASSSSATGHTHSGVGFTLDSPGSTSVLTESSNQDYENASHNHSFSGGSTSAATTSPPYIEVVLAQIVATTTIGSGTDGMIAMFNDTPPANWAAVSAINDSNYFIMPNSSAYGATGGSAMHWHANSAYTADATTDIVSGTGDQGPGNEGADYGHTHSVTVQFGEATNIPPYREAIFAKYTYSAPSNSAPTVSSVSLNGGNDIDLTENSTKSISCSAVIEDTNGGSEISSATGTVHRSGATNGANCTDADDDCYQISAGNCTLSAVYNTNYKDATCTDDILFFADPTDTGSTDELERWECRLQAVDSSSAETSATNTAEVVDMNTLLAVIVESSFNYGSLDPGTSSGSGVTLTVTTTGNIAVDVNISGLALKMNSATLIDVPYQEFAISDVGYGSGTDLATTTQALALASGTPSSNPSTESDMIYWTMEAPAGLPAGVYSGTTTIDAKADV